MRKPLRKESRESSEKEVWKYLEGTRRGEVQDVALYRGPMQDGPGPFYVWGEATLRGLKTKRTRRTEDRLLGPFQSYGDAIDHLLEIRGTETYASYWAFGVGDESAPFSGEQDESKAGQVK